MSGLLKVMSALPLRLAAPNLHFQRLNPHCDLEDLPSCLPVELSQLAAVANHVSSGLSSFGFGGTNAHVVLEDSVESLPELQAAPVFKRQSFAWQSQRHALLSRTLRTSEGSQLFVRPFSGKFLELVSWSPSRDTHICICIYICNMYICIYVYINTRVYIRICIGPSAWIRSPLRDGLSKRPMKAGHEGV